MVNGVPVQGDIVMMNLSPKMGYEQRGYRPYICLSHKLISDIANIAVFAPISTTTRRYPLYIPLAETETAGVVMLDQLVTVDYNARGFRFVESVSKAMTQELLGKVILLFQPNAN